MAPHPTLLQRLITIKQQIEEGKHNEALKNVNILITSNEKDAKPKTKRKPSAYNLFMKQQNPILRDAYPNLAQKDIMAKIAEAWNKSDKKAVNAVVSKSASVKKSASTKKTVKEPVKAAKAVKAVKASKKATAKK